MERRRAIALFVGGIATLTVFVVTMWLLAFGGLFPGKDRLIVLSVALGPVAMLSVMMGYAVWWLVMFLLTLISSDENTSYKP
jgi:NADH:ubiquinone oxidoreductase subunit 6 (subunit J)